MLRRRLAALTVAACALAATLPAGATAAPEYEPNDGIDRAFGPLQTGTNYDAAISSNDDPDWYIVYVSGQGVLDVKVSNVASTTSCCPFITITLRDSDGTQLNSAGADEGETANIPYTTPGPGFYYVETTGGVGSTYRLTVTGPVTDGPRPAPGQATPNNNPGMSSAFGPLDGSLYEASIDASGEEDWFLFHTAGAGGLDVALTTLSSGTACSGCGYAQVRLLDASGTSLNSAAANEDRRAHIQYTASGRQSFFLQATGNTGSNYEIQVSPGALLTSAPPPPPPPPAAAPLVKLRPIFARPGVLARQRGRRVIVKVTGRLIKTQGRRCSGRVAVGIRLGGKKARHAFQIQKSTKARCKFRTVFKIRARKLKRSVRPRRKRLLVRVNSSYKGSGGLLADKAPSVLKRVIR